jgi:hypothetical protein
MLGLGWKEALQLIGVSLLTIAVVNRTPLRQIVKQ